MNPEHAPPNDSSEQILGLSPEQFSHACDNLVNDETSPEIFTDVSEAVDDNRLVVFALTHQSYFDIEIYRHLCEKINQNRQSPIESYLIYSAPAVGINIGGLLKKRDRVYKENHLNMLGIIRDKDRLDPRYKLNITPEMELESEKNKIFYNEKTCKGGCISFIPFEATLQSGRINPDTGIIYGMQEVTNNLLLISAIRQQALIIPCGIDGSYKAIDPNKHNISDEFRKQNKIITLRTGQPIDLLLPKFQGKRTRDLYHGTTVNIARLVSRPAQGDYQKYIAA